MRLSTNHVVPYAFPMVPTIEGKITGGLPAVLQAEFGANRGRVDRLLTIISTDAEDGSYPASHTSIRAADPSAQRMPFYHWFSNMWAKLHPQAFVESKGHGPAVMAHMYRGDYASAPGTFERVAEHYEQYPEQAGLVEAFADRFRRQMDRVAAGTPDQKTVVNFQDPHFFFAEVLRNHGTALRDAGHITTGHIHTTYPANFNQTNDGRTIIESLRSLDVIYVHTEAYRTRLLQHLRDGEGRVPRVEIFRLGIDTGLLSGSLQYVNAATYEEALKADLVREDQRALVAEAVRTKGKGMHRFSCIDRSDPTKGILPMLEALDLFLTEQAKRGDVADKYRFFGIHDQFDRETLSETDPRDRYTALLKAKYADLQRRFPGVIFLCPSVPRQAIPLITDDTYPVSGCIEDGLNLAWPEITYINHLNGRGRPGVMATGSGFAMETLRNGFGPLGFFVQPGDVEGMAEAMHRAVSRNQHEHDRAVADERRITTEWIIERRDSVVVDPTL